MKCTPQAFNPIQLLIYAVHDYAKGEDLLTLSLISCDLHKRT